MIIITEEDNAFDKHNDYDDNKESNNLTISYLNRRAMLPFFFLSQGTPLLIRGFLSPNQTTPLST